MNKGRFTGGRAAAAVLLILINTLFLVWMISQDLPPLYKNNLLLDAFYLALCELLLGIYGFSRQFNLFDPLFFVSAIYLTMFFITPIYDILTGTYYWFGYSLFPYGIQTSTIAFFGYFAMYLVYCMKLKRSFRNEEKAQSASVPEKHLFTLPVIYGMYLVALVANIYYLIHSGYGSLRYLLTLGFADSGSSGEVVSNIGFVSMFSYSLPTIVLLHWEYSKRTLMKVLLFIPMFILQVARGFRFFIIQIVVTFAAYYCLRRGKRIKWRRLFLYVAVMIAVVLLMTVFRESIRGGNGVDFSQVDMSVVSKAFDEALWDNLRIYQNVYGMVDVIPSEYPFVGLRQIVTGTLVMAVPRAIWPNKISSYGGEGLRTLIGGNIGSGQAYPALGEYYYAFGVGGVILFMVIFGFWLKKIRDRYMYSRNPLDIIYFSVMLGCCLQLIIRGYFPSNFWYIVFAILPIWIIKLLQNNTSSIRKNAEAVKGIK